MNPVKHLIYPVSLLTQEGFLDSSLAQSMQIANEQLRLNNLETAERLFRDLIVQKPDAHRARSNYALTLFLRSRLGSAKEQLEKVLAQDSSLVFSKALLGYCYAEENDLHAAILWLEKALESPEAPPELNMSLTKWHESLGNSAQAIQCYEKLFKEEPENFAARKALVRRGFKEGEALFLRNQLFDAFDLWSTVFKTFGELFGRDRFVVQGMNTCIKQFGNDKGIQQALSEFKTSVSAGPQTSMFYKVFVKLFFSLGLIPEIYSEEKDLEKEFLYWKSEVERRESYPYGGLRLACVECYLGKLTQAIIRLQKLSDQVPKRKQRKLKISEVLDFAQLVLAIAEKRDLGDSLSFDDLSWQRSGFENFFEREKWKRSGFSPESAKKWKDSGFSVLRARQWRQLEKNISDVETWTSAGFSSAKEARSWIRAKIEPQVASAWKPFFENDISRAIQCIHLGFSTPAEALSWLKEFSMPWDAAAWRDAGFSLEQAKELKLQGWSEPFRAKEALQKVQHQKNPETE